MGGPTASVGGDNTPVPPYMAPHAQFRHLLNLRGQVAGVSATADGSFHPFLWEDGTMTDLGELPGGCDHASPSALNLWGQVVGGCTRGDQPRGFLWRNGRMIDLGATTDVGGPLDIDIRGRVVTVEFDGATGAVTTRRLTVRG